MRVARMRAGFLEFSDHPAAITHATRRAGPEMRHPSNGGELGAVLYFSHCGRRGISRYCTFRTAIIAHAL